MESYQAFNQMVIQAMPSIVINKFYCPLTVDLYTTNSWGDINDEAYEEDGEFAARHEDAIRDALYAEVARDEEKMAEYSLYVTSSQFSPVFFL